MSSTNRDAPVHVPSGSQGMVHKSNSSLTLSSTSESRFPAIIPSVSRERGTDPDAPWTASTWVGNFNKEKMFRALQKAGKHVSVYGNTPWRNFASWDFAKAIVVCRNKRVDQGLIEGTPVMDTEKKIYTRKPRSIGSATKNDLSHIHTAPGKEPKLITKRQIRLILGVLRSQLLMIKNAASDEAETMQHGSPQGGVDDTNLLGNPYPEDSRTPLTDYRIIFDSSSRPIISGEAEMLVRMVLHRQHKSLFYRQQCGDIADEKKFYSECLGGVYDVEKAKLWREIMMSISGDIEDSEIGKQVRAIVNDTFADVDDL
ncbi:hypothetical protein BKA58DRAFT_447294 [Alternaria rosae]|uniref:uncharacterized protein n=1 Tax=Alternaria rosae TaxID=1187941 RepID=UPI001E8CF082|nr:uncharacterized protein BKA58DRAFT_447294 [Alternaria rosae]KAH6882659.1 hypothetical protein BKA58DRAFT_447294 [Alternaria rosae]